MDVSFSDDKETYRSTSGFVVWFGGSPVDWECKRQPLITMSTMKSEYVAASKCVLSIRFLHKFLRFFELNRGGPTKVHKFNAAYIAVSTKPVFCARSKHIGVKYHNVREAAQNGEVELVQVWTEHNPADLFTKMVPQAKFIRFRETLMGRVSFNTMVANHVKVTKLDTQTAAAVAKWPILSMPLTESDLGSQILGFTTLAIPGYGSVTVGT